MKIWWWVIGVFGILLVSVGLFFVFVTGGNQYLRAMQLIYTAPQTSRDKMKVDLFATDNKNTYGGIYSGVFRGKVWIWGRSGLKSFAVDQYSVYIPVDGCSETALNNAKKPVPDRVPDTIITTIDSWQKMTRTGDYIVVIITPPGTGGTVGNLREIHSYNYWPFLRGPMEVLCAK